MLVPDGSLGFTLLHKHERGLEGERSWISRNEEDERPDASGIVFGFVFFITQQQTPESSRRCLLPATSFEDRLSGERPSINQNETHLFYYFVQVQVPL